MELEEILHEFQNAGKNAASKPEWQDRLSFSGSGRHYYRRQCADWAQCCLV